MKRIPSIGGGLVLFLALLPAIPAMGAGTAALPNPPPEADAPLPDAPAPMTDIHDILPPVSVGIYAPWLVPVLLALAAAAILAVAWWFWKKYKKARIIETIIPELPPEMTAMQALDEISDVCRLGGKTFYFRLSAILRQYVFGRFAVGAPEMTTEEFVGGETAVEKQMETDLFFAREFVRKTTPTTDTENRTSGGEPPKVLLLI
ncbi:MAG: hypothetical protein HGJ94_05585 [Desulfosarcina sp.]|nr:hypothetical protein [Desulfosarcina sp.]